MFQAMKELQRERMEAREGMKPLLEKLGRGERLSVEERTDLDARNAKISEVEAELRSYEAAAAVADAAAAEAPEARTETVSPDEAEARAFTSYLKRGVITPGFEDRAAGIGTPSAGGYTVPSGWWQNLQVALKAYGGIAKAFHQLVTDSGQPLPWATVDPTAVVGALVGSGGMGGTGTNENQALGTQDYTFGTGSLGAYMYTSGIQLVSFQLMNDSAFDIDAFVRARVGESLGRAQAAAVISGDGSSKPQGIINALNGKGTAGTVGGGAIASQGGFVTLATGGVFRIGGAASTELLQNSVNVNTLRAMIAAVDPAYRAQGAAFYMNDAQLLGLRGLEDTNGRPLVNITDGVTPGEPSTIWGFPVHVDNNIPNLAVSTTGGPVFGHLDSAMVLRTVNQAGLLRLTERYADALQVGFIGYMRWDSRSNDLRAAVTVKAAAS